MGFVVESDGKTIWSPSMAPAILFTKEIEALEYIVDQKSGVTSHLADMLDVDAEMFKAFLQAILERLETTSNETLFAMAEGCVAVAIALQFRISQRWPDTSPRTVAIVERAHALLAHMAD